MFNLMNKYHKRFNSLNKLKPQKENNEKRKQEVLTNVGDIYNELYNAYKSKCSKKIDKLSVKDKMKLNYKKLRLSDNYLYSSEEEKEEEEQKPTKDDYKILIKQITDEETNINDDLFNKYFSFQRPSDMITLLNKTNDTEKSNKLVNLINSGLKDLKEEIKKMSEAEMENEDPNLIENIVEKILKFNKQNQQKGQGIKILTPNQMLNRLPIALAQLQAGNNSNKLKNEIRQLLYSLYRLKNMTEQIYKSLIGII